MPTDTSERGLERLICRALTGAPCDPGTEPAGEVGERPANYGVGWVCGDPGDYDQEYCVDLAQLSAFLRETQTEVAVPKPSANEHHQTTRHLGETTSDIRKAIERNDRKIDLLREYHTRLVVDVVTGKLDVREAAARLPDLPAEASVQAGETDEPEPLDEIDAEGDMNETGADDTDAMLEEAEA
jgi:hypothetical protein